MTNIYVYIQDGRTVCSNEKPADIPYLLLHELPSGNGKLCTDLKTVWYEEIPEVKKPVIIPIDKKLEAQQERLDFLEDCIAEMAAEIYK